MEDLGEFGFWLAMGVIVAAWILSSGQKEREKQRQKQETLRALLTTEGKGTTEILAYMRESDAAEQKREADVQVAMNKAGRKLLAIFAAVIVGIISFLVSVRVFNVAGDQTQSWPVAVVLLVPFAVGALVAFFVYVLIRSKKKAPPSGA